MSTATDPATAPVVGDPAPVPAITPVGTDPIGPAKVIPRPHMGPGPVITPGFIFLNAVPIELGDVSRTAIGYYPFFKALSSPTTGTPDQLVVRSSGPVVGPHTSKSWEGVQQYVVFEKTNALSTGGKFSWIIFEDAETQLVDSVVGAAKLVLNDEMQTFVVKKDKKHVVFEEEGWKYEAVYYCE